MADIHVSMYPRVFISVSCDIKPPNAEVLTFFPALNLYATHNLRLIPAAPATKKYISFLC